MFKTPRYCPVLYAPLKTVVIVVIFSILLPNFYLKPIGAVFAFLSLLYIGFFKGGFRQLRLRMTGTAKKYSLIIIAIILPLTIGMFFVGQRIVAEDIEEFGVEYDDSYRYDTGPRLTHQPDSVFYEAMHKKDIIRVLKYSWYDDFVGLVLAPVFETIIFFALLFPALWKRIGYRWSYLVTSTIFMSLHIVPRPGLGLITIYILGLIMTWLYVRTRSIVPSIIFHSLWNLLVTTMIVSSNWGFPPPHSLNL